MAADAPSPYAAANDKIRDATKWLIGAAAAVGAALIAGSQLSSIGKLDACWGWNEHCLRLPIALLGAVLALVAITYIIWTGVRILLPVGVTLAELEQHWDDADLRADVAFFKANPAQLGFARPADLETARETAWQALFEARAATTKATANRLKSAQARETEAQAEFDDYQLRVKLVTGVAQYQLVRSQFTSLLRRLIPATALTALGIVGFAWAANPPTPPPPSIDLSHVNLTGADLRDAVLDGADLTGANLTDTDLRGASMKGARLKDVIWHATTCPDGVNSDSAGGTCLGHLSAG